MQLTKELQDSLDVFHLRGLRKILRMQTTYVDPTNTNRKVYDRAHQELNRGKLAKRFLTLSESYRQRRLTMLAKIMCLPAEDYRRTSVFASISYTLRQLHTRRSGRP
eukprot:3710485-Prorocentrum_lima.AAC.1